MRRFHMAKTSLSHAWILDLLYSAPPAVTWAPAGQLPAGYRRAGQLVALPSGSRHFLVSTATARGAAGALTSYNALRSGRTRVARRVLGTGLRTGLAWPLLRGKIDIGVAPGSTDDELDASLLTAHLGRLLGQDRVVIAIGAGSGPYRKPVLQVFSAAGAPLGYVKIGWNDWTREAVRQEAAALRACARRPMRTGVPALISLSSWRGLDLLVTAPLPRRVRGLGADAPVPDVAALREISQLGPGRTGSLAASSFWLGLRSRIAAVTDPQARAALTQAAERIERAHGGTRLEFGAWHGDLVPWNLATLGGQLYAWDWESSTPDVPVGFDALHFHFQVAFVSRGIPLPQAAGYAAGAATPALTGLGVAADSGALVATLHLIELFLRHEEARGSSGDADERFFPAITGVLGQALAGAWAQAGSDTAGRVA